MKKEEPKNSEWVFERSSGYAGYRNSRTHQWLYEEEFFKMFPKEEFCDNCKNDICCCVIKKPLDVVAERYYEENKFKSDYPHDPYSFKDGYNEAKKTLYTEEEVRELLETQRGNSYVAVLSYTKDDDIASIALRAPEPGGKNGTWVKTI